MSELGSEIAQRRARQAERAMDRLRLILDPNDPPPLWSAWQASWYLIGIYIDNSEPSCEGQPAMYAWLPDAAEKFNADPWIREMDVDSSHTYVSAFCKGESRTAAEWLKHALAKHYRPVWLNAALADRKCRSFIPNPLLRSLGVSPNGDKRQVRGAKAKHLKDPKSQAMERLKPLFFDLLTRCPKKVDGSPAKGVIAEWAQQMSDDLAEEHDVDLQVESILNAARRWRKDAVTPLQKTSC